MSTVQDPRKTCLATEGLLTVWWRMPSLGPRLSLSSSGCCLPLVGVGPVCSSPLVFTQSFVLWVGPQCLRLVFLWEISLSLSLSFLSFWLSHSLGCYLTLASSDCPQSIQAGPMPPCSAPTCLWWMPASGVLLTRSCHKGRNLWVLFIYLFFLLVMLTSEIPKLPTDPLVSGFPSVWKFFLF